MRIENQDYYYNPYLPEERQGKGEMMSLIRATLLLCMTAIICVGSVVFSKYKADRFQVIPYKEGVFIFDRQSTATNYCNDTKCVVVSSEFLIPKQVLVAEIPGVVIEQKPAVSAPAPVQQQITAPQRTPVRNEEHQTQVDLVTPNYQGSTMTRDNRNFGNNMMEGRNETGGNYNEMNGDNNFNNNQNYNNNNFE